MKLRKEKFNAILSHMFILYGGLFQEWWQEKGQKEFFKYAKKKGTSYIKVDDMVDCEKCLLKNLNPMKDLLWKEKEG